MATTRAPLHRECLGDGGADSSCRPEDNDHVLRQSQIHKPSPQKPVAFVYLVRCRPAC